MTREGGGGGRRKERGWKGANDFFNGIFKDGFKLEVISMFMLERRKSKKTRVLVCECACQHLYVGAGSNYRVLQAFKPTTI